MRYIPLKETEPPPDDWLQKANQILNELKAAPDVQTRKEIIDRNSKVWGELKGWLLTLSHEKCWFSEVKDCFNHWDVEHFRPKKSVKDDTQHEGYWWLAFDWHNFRICGNVGNRKKGTYFPLCNGSCRARKPTDDLRQENPLLLDPADPDDPNLLSFNLEGKAIPAADLNDAWDKRRVEYSIERYNLDFGPLEAKRKIVWSNCWTHIQQYRQELKRLNEDNTNLIARNQVKEKAKAIRDMLQADKELSAVARACVLSSGDPRVMNFLQSA